jgi:RimJ/RimL family protein N-acetyltransferase
MAISIPDEKVIGSLRDGTPVTFRPIRPSDKALLRRGMSEMSPESRYHRFFAATDTLSPAQLRYFTEIDYQDHFAWVGYIDTRPAQPVGVGRFIRLADRPTAAEAAVTIVDHYQRQGVGSAVMRLLAHSAIERGISQFVFAVMGDNEAMMHLLTSVGAQLDHWEEGIAYMHVDLPATIEELDASPLPSILRATAEGKLQGRAGPRGVGVRFEGHGSD